MKVYFMWFTYDIKERIERIDPFRWTHPFCSQQLEYLEDKLRELRFVSPDDAEQKVRLEY